MHHFFQIRIIYIKFVHVWLKCQWERHVNMRENIRPIQGKITGTKFNLPCNILQLKESNGKSLLRACATTNRERQKKCEMSSHEPRAEIPFIHSILILMQLHRFCVFVLYYYDFSCGLCHFCVYVQRAKWRNIRSLTHVNRRITKTRERERNEKRWNNKPKNVLVNDATNHIV